MWPGDSFDVINADEDGMRSDAAQERYYLVAVRKDWAALERLVNLKLARPVQSCDVDPLILVAHKFYAACNFQPKWL